MFPKCMNMSKVNFGAIYEPDYIKNWKLIQTVFEKQGIQKVIPVDKLVKGRFQDNLEFLQWFYQYFTATYNPSATDYDPVKRRLKSKGTAGLSKNKPSAPKKRKKVQRENPYSGPARRSANSAPFASQSADPVAGGLKRQVEQLEQEKTQLQDKHHQLQKEFH